MSKPILIVTVKSDQHGNPPSKHQINAISRKMKRAVAEAGDNHAVVVLPETVQVKMIS